MSDLIKLLGIGAIVALMLGIIAILPKMILKIVAILFFIFLALIFFGIITAGVAYLFLEINLLDVVDDIIKGIKQWVKEVRSKE